MSFVPVIVVVIGLRVSGVGDDDADLGLYIAAGYSVDSIAGLFLTRFDTGAKKALKGVEKQIEGQNGNGGGGGSNGAGPGHHPQSTPHHHQPHHHHRKD